MVVTKLSSKKWQAKFSVKVDETRYYRKRVFPTKTEAEAWETEERYALVHPKETASKVAFSEYAENYVNLYKSQGSARTYALYLGTVAKIKEQFGERALVSISKDELQEWLNEFGKTHAVTTSEKLYRQLHVIIGAALDAGIIDRDITKGLVFTGTDPVPPDDKFLEFDDYMKLLHYLRESAGYDRITEMMMLFALVTGARYGEAAGMTWDNINFKKATITIDKQWVPNRHKFIKTKNSGKSDRIISIPPQVLPMFQKMKAVQQLVLKNTGRAQHSTWSFNGRDYHDEDLMFLASSFEVPQNDSCNSRLDDVCRDLAIKHITMHGLRHTHATRLIYEAYSDWYIAKRLGHNSLKELHRTYGHVFETMQAEADTRLRDSIGRDFEGKTNDKVVKLPAK